MAMMQRTATVLCVLSLGLSSIAAAEIYRWTDEKGNVHFSDSAPKDVKAEDVSERLRDAASIYTPVTPPSRTTAPLQSTKQPLHIVIDATAPSGPSQVKARPVSIEISLVDYELAKNDSKRIHAEIELVYRKYVEWFGWSVQPRYPVKVRIFGRVAAFDAYPMDIEPEKGHRSHYAPRRREVLMHGTKFTEDTLATLRHEVSHAILDMEMRGVPSWINEGLAEVFRSSESVRSELRLTTNPEWAEILKLKLREGSLAPWSQYLGISNTTWRSESVRVERSYYMISWSMMRFLLSSKAGTKCLHAVMTDGRKSGYSGLAGLFERQCGDSKRLDADWRAWIKAL